MRFRIGEPIDSRVSRKIQSLQKVFSTKDGVDRGKYIELQGAVPWIRMQSGVKVTDKQSAKDYNVEPGYELAKKYVLFGANTRISADTYSPNTPDISGLPGYERSTAFDIRPKPGITSMGIRSHNRFGSLRTASVRFVCWTKEQMDAIEVLFMRPGYSVLLEWGYSKNLTVDGSSVEELNLGVDLYGVKDTADAVYEEITKKRLSNSYGYDAILGQIKNFSWSLRPDGGYDCITELISPGDLIESYKANFFLPQSDVQAALDDEIEDAQLTLKFPSVYIDSTDVPYELSIAPQVKTLYDNFLVQAKADLENAKNTFKKRLDDAILANRSQDSQPLVELWQAVIGKPGEAIAILTEDIEDEMTTVYELISMLEIAQGNSSHGDIRVDRGHTTTVIDFDGQTIYGTIKPTWYNTVSAKLASPWTDGIADLDVTLNGTANIDGGTLKADLPAGGYVALVPKDISLFQFKFLGVNGIRTYNKGGNQKRIRKYLQIVGAALALDDKWSDSPLAARPANIQTGVGPELTGLATAVWDSWYGGNNNPSNTQDTNLRNDAPMWVSLTKDPGVAYLVTEVPTDDLGYIINRKTQEYYIPAKNSPYGQDKVGAISPVAPILFLPMHYTGFDPSVATSGDLTNQEEDELRPAVIVDSYVSKLHFYLRTFVELPYAADHLLAPTPNEEFSSIFQYRTFETSKLLVALNGGEKADLPKNYKGIPSKVQNDVTSILGGSFFNEDITIYTNAVYVKLGTLLEFINKHILRSNSEYFFTFATEYEKGYEPLYFSWSDHISADPRVCILPHTVLPANLNITGYTGDGVSRILDIELNINFILEILNQYIGNDGKVSVYDFIQALLDNISRVCGGVNDLQLQFVEDSYREYKDSNGVSKYEIFRSKFHVVDRKVIAPITRQSFEQIGAKLNLFGLDSIVHDVRLESKLTPKISSMVAISAQDSPYTSGEEATGFNAINRGLVDRIFTTRYDIEKKINEEQFTEQSFEKGREWLKEQVTGVVQNLAYFYEKAATPPNAEEQIGTYENYSKFLLGLSNKFGGNTGQRATYNFIIPFELNLTLRGIAGLKVMDAFITSQDILPKTYGGRKDSPVAFLITGVEHTVDSSGWKTNLRTQIYNIDENQAYIDPFKDLNLKEDLKISAARIVLETRTVPQGPDGSGRTQPGRPSGAKGARGVGNAADVNDMPANMIDRTAGLYLDWAPVKKGYGATVTSTPLQTRTIGTRTGSHLGIDIAATTGAPVYATAAGTLKFVKEVFTDGTGGGYGLWAVYIVDGNNWSHLYGHLSGNPTNIVSGMTVKLGDTIGYIGNEGISTGPHLHYEIINSLGYKGQRTNPEYNKLQTKDPIKYLNALTSANFPDAEVY